MGTRVIILMHWSEQFRTSNTGRLASLALQGAELRIFDAAGVPDDASGLDDPEREGVLLFPGEEAVELTPAWAASRARPVTLLVPDGTWRRARRMVRRNPLLQGIPRVTLPPGGPSEYQLRTNRREGAVCTLEAVARALGILEGPQVQARLEEVLREMNHRVLSTRPLGNQGPSQEEVPA